MGGTPVSAPGSPCYACGRSSRPGIIGRSVRVARFTSFRSRWDCCSSRVKVLRGEDVREAQRVAQLHPSSCIATARREAGDLTVGRMLINACRPFTWRDQFPKSNVFSSQERKLVEAKYRELFESAAKKRSAWPQV